MPAWFSLSCVHPDVAALALAHAGPAAVGRLREVKANASRRPTAELVELRHLDAGDPHEWATAMTTLHERFGVPVLGGCCGTDDRHLNALARLLTSRRLTGQRYAERRERACWRLCSMKSTRT